MNVLDPLPRNLEIVVLSLCDKPYEPVPEDKNKLYEMFIARDMWLKPIEDETEKVENLNCHLNRAGSLVSLRVGSLEQAVSDYSQKFLKDAAADYPTDLEKVKVQVQSLVDSYLKVRSFMDKTRSGKYPKLSEFVRRHAQNLSYRLYDVIHHAFAVIKLQNAYGDMLPYRLFMNIGRGKKYNENDLMAFYFKAMKKNVPSSVCHRGLLGFCALTSKPKYNTEIYKGQFPLVGRIEVELEKCYDIYYKNVTPGRGLLTQVDEKHLKWRSKLTKGSVLHSVCWSADTNGFYRNHHVFTLGAPDTTNSDSDLITFPVTKYETWQGRMTDETKRFKCKKNCVRMDWSLEEGMNIPPQTRQVQPHEHLQITIGKSTAEPYMNSLHPGRCWDLPIPPVELIDPEGRFVVQRRMTPIIPLDVFEGGKAPSDRPLEGVLKFTKHLVSSTETPIPLSPKYLVLSQDNVLHYSQYVRKGRFDLFRIENFLLEASARQNDLYKAYGEQSKLFDHPYHKMAHDAIVELIRDKANIVATINKYVLIYNIKDRQFRNAVADLMVRVRAYLFTCSEQIEAELHIGSMVPSERAKVRAIVAEKWVQFKTATFIWPTLSREVAREYLARRKNSTATPDEPAPGTAAVKPEEPAAITANANTGEPATATASVNPEKAQQNQKGANVRTERAAETPSAALETAYEMINSLWDKSNWFKAFSILTLGLGWFITLLIFWLFPRK